MSHGPTACVIGAGISGVSAAHYLKKMGFQVEILEATDKIGGRAGSMPLGNRKVDMGGKNIGSNYRLLRRIISELGPFEYERLGSYATYRDGRVARVTHKNKLKTLRNFVDIMGVRDFVKMMRYGREVIKDERNGYLGGPFFRQLSEVLDDAPMATHFSEDLCWKFLRLIVLRNSGAEPDEFFAGNLGHLLFLLSGPTTVGPLECLVQGMSSFFERFSERNTILRNTRVTDILVKGGRVVGVRTQNTVNNIEQERPYDAVVVATPAYACADIIETVLPELAPGLRRVAYNPVGVAVVQYDHPVFQGDYSSVAFDRTHEIFAAAAYVVNEPDLVRYTFSGRTSRELVNENTSSEEALEVAERTVRTHTDLKLGRRVDYVFKYYKTGLTSHSPRHHHLLDQITALTGNIKGLALSGDYVCGGTLEGCCRASKIARDKIAIDARDKLTMDTSKTQADTQDKVVMNTSKTSADTQDKVVINASKTQTDTQDKAIKDTDKAPTDPRSIRPGLSGQTMIRSRYGAPTKKATPLSPTSQPGSQTTPAPSSQSGPHQASPQPPSDAPAARSSSSSIPIARNAPAESPGSDERK